MNKKLEGKWWQNVIWNGMKAVPSNTKEIRSKWYQETFIPCNPFTWVSWSIPAETQHGPSCAGHGIANFKEIMLRRYHKSGSAPFAPWQEIDGDAIWAYARRKFYDGDMDGGLYIPQAFEAALEMGIFSKGSQLKTIKREDALYGSQFELTPFIDGHDVSGWYKNGLSDNGQVYEGGQTDGTGGHCTVHVSRMVQNGKNFWQNLNSWGTSFGWHGLFITTEFFDFLTGLENSMYYVVEPEGWENDDGWRKYVIG